MTIKRLIGSAPNQISRNRDLGSLAFQNKENVRIETLTIDNGIEVNSYSSEAVVKIKNNLSGSSWLTLSPSSSGAAYIHNITNTPTIFTTNSIERVRITGTATNAYFGIGQAPISEGLNVAVYDSWALGYFTSAQPSGKFSGILVESSRGTLAARSPIQSGDILGFLRFNGFTTSTTTATGAEITAVSNSNFTSTNSETYLKFSTTSSGSTTTIERMRIGSDGLVGIGTNSPAGFVNSGLAVVGVHGGNQCYIGSSTSAITIGGYTGAVYLQTTSTNDLVTGTGSTGNLIFRTAATERARFTSTGSFGIGTSSPVEKVDIRGNLAIGGSLTSNYISFRGTSGDGEGTYNHGYIGERIYASTESSELLIFKGNDPATSAGPDRIRLLSADIVFDTFSSVAISGTFDTIGATTSNVNTRMIIKSDGKVGINTTSPTGSLNVVGDVYLDNSGESFNYIRRTSTGAVNNYVGNLTFQANNASGSLANYAKIYALQATTTTGTNSGKLFLSATRQGTQANYITLDGSGDIIQFEVGGVEKARFTSVGLGIGTSSPSYTLHVNGSFAATTKSFVIDHPTKAGKKLRYGSLEGPENGVYVRGKLTGNVIELPEYWTKLIDEDTITVQLTPIGKHQKLYVDDIKDNKVYVKNDSLLSSEVKCFFVVFAERIDVDKLEVEID